MQISLFVFPPGYPFLSISSRFPNPWTTAMHPIPIIFLSTIFLFFFLFSNLFFPPFFRFFLVHKTKVFRLKNSGLWKIARSEKYADKAPAGHHANTSKAPPAENAQSSHSWVISRNTVFQQYVLGTCFLSRNTDLLNLKWEHQYRHDK